METTSKTRRTRRYDSNAYRFIFPALRYAQSQFRPQAPPGATLREADAHITGQELVQGIRSYAHEQFGMLARTVFNSWGIFATEDFGNIVFELIERGEMKKTEDDCLEDFCDVYDFEEAFDDQSVIDVSRAFSRP